MSGEMPAWTLDTFRRVAEAWSRGDEDAAREVIRVAELALSSRVGGASPAEVLAALQRVVKTVPADVLSADDVKNWNALRGEVIRALGGVHRGVQPVGGPQEPLPQAVLRCEGKGGALLARGSVCVFAGVGHVGKTLLTTQIAYAQARGDLQCCGLEFPHLHGVDLADTPSVLLASAEEPLAIYQSTAGFIRSDRGDAEIPSGLGYLSLENLPLFGDAPGAHAKDPPVRLSGWTVLERAVEKSKPAMVVIDSAGAVFLSESNSLAAVRMFLAALTEFARRHDLGILLVAHPNKAARYAKRDKRADSPDAVAGSTAWVDGARGVLTFTWDDTDTTLGVTRGRLLTVNKANWGPSGLQLSVRPRMVTYGMTGQYKRPAGFESAPGESWGWA